MGELKIWKSGNRGSVFFVVSRNCAPRATAPWSRSGLFVKFSYFSRGASSVAALLGQLRPSAAESRRGIAAYEGLGSARGCCSGATTGRPLLWARRFLRGNRKPVGSRSRTAARRSATWLRALRRAEAKELRPAWANPAPLQLAATLSRLLPLSPNRLAWQWLQRRPPQPPRLLVEAIRAE